MQLTTGLATDGCLTVAPRRFPQTQTVFPRPGDDDSKADFLSSSSFLVRVNRERTDTGHSGVARVDNRECCAQIEGETRKRILSMRFTHAAVSLSLVDRFR
jgi:hypothetical protein